MGRNSFLQKEFYLLYKLMSYLNKDFHKTATHGRDMGMDSTSDERTVDVHINHLQERFRDCDDFSDYDRARSRI